MSLNIKNPETVKAVKQLAQLSGKGMTAVVDEAVREMISRLLKTKREGIKDRLLALGAEAAARLTPEQKKLDLDSLLYDEKGLPK